MAHRLWGHQERALDQIAAEFRRGHRSICVVIPTGGGKTITAAAAAVRHLTKCPEGKVLFTAHREELVAQAFDALTEAGLECGVIQATPSRTYNPYRPVQIASIQTMLARSIVPDATFVIHDEFHHMASDKWETLGMEYRKRRVPIIGLTATPIRGDGRGFEGLMDAIVTPITMKELIEQGFLVPYTLHAPKRELRSNQIAKSPVVVYQQHAAGRKAVVFAPSVKAATTYRDEFRAAGITAELVHGELDPIERRRVLDAYRDGRVQVITNVGVLTEGFDDRPTSCVILARSVGSLALFLQMVGRALRCSPETGKRDAVIIDLHGSCRVHGEPADDREWTLEGDGRGHRAADRAKERFCPVCKVLIEGNAGPVCELCEYARPELSLPDIANVELERYAAKKKESPEQRKAYFDKLKATAHANGYNKWQPHMKYKALYGEPPPRAWW